MVVNMFSWRPLRSVAAFGVSPNGRRMVGPSAPRDDRQDLVEVSERCLLGWVL